MASTHSPPSFRSSTHINLFNRSCFGPSVVATALAPKGFIERLEAENRITPMTTILTAVDFFIDPKSKVTGQMVENCGTKNVVRKIPEYLDASAEAVSLSSLFYPSQR